MTRARASSTERPSAFHHAPVFAGLLSPDGGEVQSTLRDLKRVGSAHIVGARSFTQPLLQKWLDIPLWPAGVWIWEVIVSLPMNAWQKRVAVFARWAGGPVFSAIGTKDAEGGFNYTRRGVRWALSGTMQPASQWHNLACSNVSQEACGSPYSFEPQDRCVHKGAFRKSSFQKKTPPTSGRVASENGRPRRTGTRIRPQTSASCRIRIGLNDVAGVLALRDFSSCTVCVHAQ